VLDLAIILIQDHKPVGVWSVSLMIKNDVIFFGSSGGSLEPPMLSVNVGRRKITSLYKSCFNAVEDICTNLVFGKILCVQPTQECDAAITVWQDLFLRKGAQVKLAYDLFLDLKSDLTKIKSHLRDSYKSLINLGYKIWTVGILDCDSPNIWAEFKTLHHTVSGRVTRSDKTWQLQYDAILTDTAFLVYLRNGQNQMIGGGLFYRSCDESLYAVGVYDRALFDKPLGHVVQFHAITYLKQKGVRWHKLGPNLYPADQPTPSPKELSITEFKRGFASHIFPRYIINYESLA